MRYAINTQIYMAILMLDTAVGARSTVVNKTKWWPPGYVNSMALRFLKVNHVQNWN